MNKDIDLIIDQILIERGEHPSRVRSSMYQEERELVKIAVEMLLSEPCSRHECHQHTDSPSPMEKDEEFEKITGFKTKAEFEAYEKGREHEQAVAIKFIEKWDGSRNSVLGDLLYSKLNTTSPMEDKKARKYNSPKLQEILDEVTPSEMEQKKMEMEGKTPLKGWVNINKIILTGLIYPSSIFSTKERADAACNSVEILRLACIDLSKHYEGEGL